MATDTLTRMTLDRAELNEIDRPVFDWLTRRFGAPPSSFCRLLRWRMGWEATVTIDGVDQELVVRASRGDAFEPPISLELEARLHDVMEANGVLVPHVYGMIDEPLAIVMEKLPGGINTDLIENPDNQWKVRREFVEELAKLHKAPVQEFVDVGMPIADDPVRGSLEYYQHNCRHVRAASKGNAIPFLEFLNLWLERNMPTDRKQVAMVTADSAQFMHDDDRFTGLIDFEMCYLGDPAAEFAGFRVRDTTEPLGDIGKLRDYYEELTGDHIPHKLIAYHTVGYAGTAGFITWPLAFECDANVDYTAYLQFTICMCRWGLQGLLEYTGIESVPVAEPEANSVLPFAFSGKQGERNACWWKADDGALAYHLEAAEALAQYNERCAIYGKSVLETDLAEISAITGQQVTTRAEADRVLADWICDTATAADDEKLIRFFDGWFQRQNFLLKGCGSQAHYTEIWLQEIARRPGE